MDLELSQLYDFEHWHVAVKPFTDESISHFLGRVKRSNKWTSYMIGKAAGIGAVVSRWEKLYFNPLPSMKELEAISKLLEISLEELQNMFPQKDRSTQPRPIMLCGACYAEAPFHKISWQYKSAKAEEPICDYHNLHLLSKCPCCKAPFQIPSKWANGMCHYCRMPFRSMGKKQKRVKRKL